MGVCFTFTGTFSQRSPHSKAYMHFQESVASLVSFDALIRCATLTTTAHCRYAHCWRTSHHIIHMVASDLVCWIGCLLWGYMLQRNKVYEVQKKGYPMALNSESASKFCISCVFKTSRLFCRNSLTCRRIVSYRWCSSVSFSVYSRKSERFA